MAEVSITLKAGSVVIPTHPLFGDDIKMKFDKEENQMFLRSKLDGTVKFSREDFDFIEQAQHGTVFTLSVYLGSSLFGSCTFLKSDCTFNYDDRCCSVKIKTTDRYEKFLANYDNKYNLPKLAPICHSVTLNKRPVLQFYFQHDKKITNVFGNMSFEVDARAGSEDYDLNQIQSKGFRLLYWLKVIDIPDVTATSPFSGRYKAVSSNYAVGSRLYREDNQYYLYYDYLSQYATYAWQLYNSNGTPYSSGGDYVWVTGASIMTVSSYQCGVRKGSTYTGSTQVAIGDGYNRIIFARILSDYGGYLPTDTKVAMNTITDDVAQDNYNYLYAWTPNFLLLEDKVIVSDEVSSYPTQYGQDGNGKYFVKPTPSDPTNAIYPIGWNMWLPFSIWFESSVTLDENLRTALNTQYELRDAYPIHSVLERLLSQVDSSVSFQSTPDYSKYLYNPDEGLENMVSSPKFRESRLYITPITNVKKTRYEQPAQKGDITLKQVLDMFRMVYQCYWYIDDNNRLRIEHISFFKNNHTYAMGNPIPDEDVSAMRDMPNGKMWTFGTNEVEFERSKCPSRYEFAWGGDCTEQFNGYPIDIIDKFVDEKKKEKASVTNFTADIDYTVIYPQGVSDDIYALIEAKDALHEVAIAEVHLPGSSTPVYLMQNGYCSFLYAEQNYYPYDLGGWQARVENLMMPVHGICRAKKQNIKYPTTLAKLGNTGTVKTEIGVGLIEEQSVKADTLFADTKILMEIERDYSGEVFFISMPSVKGIRNNTEYLVTVQYRTASNSYTAIIGPNSTYTTSIGLSTDASIVSVKQNGYCEFGEFITRCESDMTKSLSMSASGADLEILGNGRDDENDWGYIRVKFNKRTRINMTASSRSSHGYGYVGELPYATKLEVTVNARGYVTGTNALQVIAEEGEILYLGYTKDDYSPANDDKISFEIEVPE